LVEEAARFLGFSAFVMTISELATGAGDMIASKAGKSTEQAD
jgi:hypothetical protein